MSSELKEVVMNADPLNLKHFAPDTLEHGLDIITGSAVDAGNFAILVRIVFRRRVLADSIEELLRVLSQECLSIDFAVEC